MVMPKKSATNFRGNLYYTVRVAAKDPLKMK